MRQHLIQVAHDTLAELKSRRHTAATKVLSKRKELQKRVVANTGDLFGNIPENKPDQLFYQPISLEQIETILQPLRAEVTKIDKEIDKWEKDLVRLANMPDYDLFAGK